MKFKNLSQKQIELLKLGIDALLTSGVDLSEAEILTLNDLYEALAVSW